MARAGARRNARLGERLRDPGYVAGLRETFDDQTAAPRSPSQRYQPPIPTRHQATLRRVRVWWCRTRHGHPGYNNAGESCRRCGYPIFLEFE
jgi:hypothetical protein